MVGAGVGGGGGGGGASVGEGGGVVGGWWVGEGGWWGLVWVVEGVVRSVMYTFKITTCTSILNMAEMVGGQMLPACPHVSVKVSLLPLYVAYCRYSGVNLAKI